MLSRLAVARKLAPATVANARCCSGPPVWKREVLVVKEHPDRDLVNFPRYKRPEHPAPVRLAFIPEEWFQFLYPKTGITGPYLLGIGLVTTILSKEVLVVEHEVLCGVVMFSMMGLVHKLYGKDIAAMIDKAMDKDEAELKAGFDKQRQTIKDAIADEELAQRQMGCQPIIYETKKENVALQLEAEFRKRQLRVFNEVKRKLDYHVEVINIERRLQQKHMAEWIVDNVLKSITPQQEKDAIKNCIADLKRLAANA